MEVDFSEADLAEVVALIIGALVEVELVLALLPFFFDFQVDGGISSLEIGVERPDLVDVSPAEGAVFLERMNGWGLLCTWWTTR